MKETKIYKSKYFVFYWAWVFNISYELCGYFDNRPRINLDLFFFSLTIILPFRNKWTDECVPPKWGIAYHNSIFWIYKGGKGNLKGGNKWWSFYAPWYWKIYQTRMMRQDGSWEIEGSRDYKQFYDEKWNNVLMYKTFDYKYALESGEIQFRKATIIQREREWRLNWFMWLPIKKVYKDIKIEFDDEIGEGTGSYKGGTTGCNYEMLKGETDLQCLRRMEKERKFSR
jgi:hypothetical protein